MANDKYAAIREVERIIEDRLPELAFIGYDEAGDPYARHASTATIRSVAEQIVRALETAT